MNRVLVVEDDEDVAFSLRSMLKHAPAEVEVAPSGAAGLDALAAGEYGAVLLDLGLPDQDGLAVIPKMRALRPHCPILVLTGRDEARTAVAALQAGAAQYLLKPWEREELLHAVRRALDESSLRTAQEVARRRSAKELALAQCQSPPWQAAMEQLRTASGSTRATVLLAGESGVGKDVAASLVHQWSPRCEGPYVAVNAACLPANLMESELFGHEAGAFTHARSTRRGLFELASGGTLFLDEVGELPLELQPRLLRVLEGHPFRRLGGERELRVDVRVVAATNRPLAQMVREGRFREDLYYRLRVLEVRLPPLRERPGDVLTLALHFLGQLSEELASPRLFAAPEVLERLAEYSWPGNVRELRNVLERAAVLARGGRIELNHLPEEFRGAPRPKTLALPLSASEGPEEALLLEDSVRRHVLHVFSLSEGNLTQAATRLGISRTALRRRLREYGVSAPMAGHRSTGHLTGHN